MLEPGDHVLSGDLRTPDHKPIVKDGVGISVALEITVPDRSEEGANSLTLANLPLPPVGDLCKSTDTSNRVAVFRPLSFGLKGSVF